MCFEEEHASKVKCKSFENIFHIPFYLQFLISSQSEGKATYIAYKSNKSLKSHYKEENEDTVAFNANKFNYFLDFRKPIRIRCVISNFHSIS